MGGNREHKGSMVRDNRDGHGLPESPEYADDIPRFQDFKKRLKASNDRTSRKDVD